MSIALNVTAGDVIDSFTSLVAEIAAWLDRDDLTPRIPGFIRLCEARFNRVLRMPEMETRLALAANSGDNALPLDFLQMREAYIPGTPNRALRSMSPNALADEFDGSAGIPVAYSITERTLRLAPPPSQMTLVNFVYFAKLPPLSNATPSNWLLAGSPDIYLYGALLQASAFIDDQNRIGQWKAAYDEAMVELVSAGSRARWGSSPLVPNTVQQVRGARC